MAHTFFCEKCGKRFDVDEALIGRRARCKDCKHEFVIPVLNVTSVRCSPYNRDKPSRPPDHQNTYTLQDDEVLPARLGKPTPEMTQKSRRSSADEAYLWVGTLTLCGAIAGGFFLVILLLGRAVESEPLTWIGIGGAAFAGIGLFLFGHILCLVIPFCEGVVEGFLYLFVPFYSLYYLITRWSVMKRPFIMVLTGSCFYFGFGVFLIRWCIANDPQFVQKVIDGATSDLTPIANRPREPVEGRSGDAVAPVAINPALSARPGGLFPTNVEQATRQEAAKLLPPSPTFPPVPPHARRPQDRAQAPGPPPAPTPALPRFGPRPRDFGPIARKPIETPDPPAFDRRQGQDRPAGDDRVEPAPDDANSPGPKRRGVPLPSHRPPGDARTAPALAELLGTHQSARAIAALKAMGSAAEAAVIPHLRSENWFARKDACQVLKVIGTEKSVSELRVIAGNHGPSAGAAREALLEIARRGGSVDPQ